MYFLIRYDRHASDLEEIKRFESSEKEAAFELKERWECEFIHRIGSVEIVLLEARTLENLKLSHKRYFESRDDLFSGSEKLGSGEPQNTPKKS